MYQGNVWVCRVVFTCIVKLCSEWMSIDHDGVRSSEIVQVMVCCMEVNFGEVVLVCEFLM